MKSAVATAAAQREVRRERLRRERALAPALREVFPAVEQLRLELLFRGAGPATPAMQSHTLHAAARAFFGFPCPYADCDGEFDLSKAVREALASPTRQASGDIDCSGKRAVRLGGNEQCRLRLDFTVTATLQSDT